MSDAANVPVAVHGGVSEHHDHPKVPYIAIAATLFVMTAITIAVSFKDFGSHFANVVIAMAIASFKASLVILFFMHLKFEKKTMVVIAIIPYVLAAILLFALFPDIVFGQYH